jgi:hypothetical protein
MSNFVAAHRRRFISFLFATIAFCCRRPGRLVSVMVGSRTQAADLSDVLFAESTGTGCLLIGILFCFLGLLFGLVIFIQLKNLPVHRSMREISELIYETCKTYLITRASSSCCSGFSSPLICGRLLLACYGQFPDHPGRHCHGSDHPSF